ncbi:polyribonucleotide nucleotidyltransferase [Candidatus Parcubacteria bacterium]|nr:MAG: polyribonucleotide nucleotidyltransferase [Candidatus Parcubacteria bacterium]
METQSYSLPLGNAALTVQLTPLAPHANGRVLVRHGDTMVLVTAVMAKRPREGGDFFPLTVDYEERFYAAGKILGSRFVKRETRPSEEAILGARLIDRTIRPRFDLRMRNEVQVIATVLSFDGEHDPDVPALLGASLALAISDIPWDGPVAGVRIGRVDDRFVVGPTIAERESGTLDMIASGTAEKLNMIETGAAELTEAQIVEALELAHAEIKKLVALEQEVIRAAGPVRKAEVPLVATTGPLRDALIKNFSERIGEAMWTADKQERLEKTAALRSEWAAFAKAEFPDATPAEITYLWDDEIDAIVHKKILHDGKRPDGRATDELRALTAEAGIIPRVHGSGIFCRGETQALSLLTLGSPGDQLIIEGMEVRTKRRYMHQYNFPPYATGETKPLRGPGRREIGHGVLAQKAILPLLPTVDEFPYTIRIVSEIISSNGSSSMASVCGSTLALFDGGVPLKKPAAGIAMGLMMESESQYRVLTDIQGPEDHYGDMDFKAAGTRDGVTAIQMDVKIDGVTIPMLAETLAQAKEARLQILDTIEAALPAPRPELSPYAPRIVTLKIDPQKIGALIGPGGKMINSITDATGVDIAIEDDGTVFVTSESAEGMTRALELIKQVTREYKPGELLEGTVTRIFDFGAMVEVAPKTEGLVHISELAPWRVGSVEDIVHVGDRIPVMVRNIDDQGRLNFSLKSVPGRYSEDDIAKGRASEATYSPPPRERHDERGPRRHHRR